MTESRKQIIHTIIVFFFMFVFGHIIPPFADVTETGVQVLGVFIGCLWGWIFTGNIGWPSLLGFVALGLTSYINMTDLIVAGVGSQTAMMLLCVLLITAFVEYSGISRVVINFMLTRKFTVGKPWIICFVFLMASFVTSILSFCTASAVMFIALYHVLADSANIPKHGKQNALFLVGISYTSVAGDVVFPFKFTGSLIMGTYETVSGVTLNWGLYSAFSIIVAVVTTLLIVLMGKFIFRIDLSMLQDVSSLPGLDKKATTREKASLILVVVALVSLFLPNVLPECTLKAMLDTLGTGGIAAFFTVLMCIIRIGGKPLATFGDIAAGFKWDIMFMVFILFPIANALMADPVGIKASLNTLITSITGDMSPTALAIFLIIVTAIVTNFANNVVVGALFISILTTMAPSMPNLNMTAVAVMIALAAQSSLFFPAASPINAICFAQTDLITFKDETIIGGAATIVLILVCILFYPISCIIF